MSSPADLITLSRATTNIPSYTSGSSATVGGLITAASRAIEKYCRRDFGSHTYDELYNGDADRRMILRQYPLISVQSVRYRPVTVIKISNTSSTSTTPIARAQVTATGISLIAAINGVYSTTNVAFSGNATITALIAAINAVGSGWLAQDTGYGAWPSADIYCPNGLSDSLGTSPSTQGALNAAPGIVAEVKLHSYELGGFQMDPRRGWLLRAIPYTDPELLHPEDLIWPVGINNFRIQYTAGFATVPEDVQEACAELVASWFQQLGRDLTLKSEDTAKTYEYSAVNEDMLPARIRAILRPYRSHRVYSPMS